MLNRSLIPIRIKTAFGLKKIISSNRSKTPSVTSPPIPRFRILGILNFSDQFFPPSVILLPIKTISLKFKGSFLKTSIRSL